MQRITLGLALSALLSTSAIAQYSVAGGGGPIPATGTGGGGNSATILPTSFGEFPLTTPVPVGASSITNVTLTGLTHTWVGDIQVVLTDPNGVGYNLLVRLGVVAPAACCGHSADFGGDYSFEAASSQNINQTWPLVNPGGAVVLPSGTYAQEFGTSFGSGWVSGSDNVFNVDLASIPVVPGTWRLFLYDGAAGDVGALVGWSMSGDSGPGTNYCTAVANSTGNSASMSASGSASVAANNLVLEANDMPQNAFGFFLTSLAQGFVQSPGGSVGNLCLGNPIGRYVGPGQIQNSGVAGSISLAVNLTQHPTPTGFVSVQPGETWHFTAWYRDAVGGTAVSNFADGLSVAFN